MDILITAFGALNEAIWLIVQPQQLLYLFLGVIIGLSVGVFPGLGGIAGLSLVLPFVYGMEPVSGLALMVGLVAVIPTSDTFASVLLGIPGSSASQATVLDGFPLARKGGRKSIGRRICLFTIWWIVRRDCSNLFHSHCTPSCISVWHP